jgi:hypothetical protein
MQGLGCVVIENSGHRTALTTADLDKLAGDIRLTAWRHVPWHLHHVAVTRCNPLSIAGKMATVTGH